MTRELFVDIETYSGVDLHAAGLYPYAESSDFEVLLIAYAYDDGPVQLLDLADDPDEETGLAALRLSEALVDPSVLKIAHNNAFERNCLGKWCRKYLQPEQWSDTMVLAAMSGLPSSLEDVGAALGIERQKMKEGSALIRYFCTPCKPTEKNGGRTRNLPRHAPDKWATFRQYCLRDVDAMRQIYRRLEATRNSVPEFERSVWCMDARINERGVLIDRELATAAIEVDAIEREEQTEELRRLTKLNNPNSVSQLKGWLDAAGIQTESLNKATVADLKAKALDPSTRRVLELRQLLGKTSIKKYTAMLNAGCADGRIRGITQYYGAARTGRWAGRLVQLQNLPQNHLDDISTVREIVRSRDVTGLRMLFDNVPDTLSQLIRTALIAKPEHTFLVADYSAIEARVIAYLAGEKWRQEVFARGGDIYCASASQMFRVPVEKHGVNGHLRQKGKIAELALGYGGGVNALIAFGADKMGLTGEEMQDIVTQWRLASPTIPRLWREAETAAKAALATPGKPIRMRCGVTYVADADALRCRLPSGRLLTYWGAALDDGGEVRYKGQNQQTRKFEAASTWGGRLVENIVQAFARDCLAVAMLRLTDEGYHIVFHVHDEIICEEQTGRRWEDMAEIMARPLDWAPGLLLRADGYATPFYMKD